MLTLPAYKFTPWPTPPTIGILCHDRLTPTPGIGTVHIWCYSDFFLQGLGGGGVNQFLKKMLGEGGLSKHMIFVNTVAKEGVWHILSFLPNSV